MLFTHYRFIILISKRFMFKEKNLSIELTKTQDEAYKFLYIFNFKISKTQMKILQTYENRNQMIILQKIKGYFTLS